VYKTPCRAAYGVSSLRLNFDHLLQRDKEIYSLSMSGPGECGKEWINTHFPPFMQAGFFAKLKHFPDTSFIREIFFLVEAQVLQSIPYGFQPYEIHRSKSSHLYLAVI
jgi:hypothetical protein